MARSVYEIYKTKVFTLAKTITVKHEETAVAMNDYMANTQGYYVDDTNRYTWRYYLNLAGEYHQADMVELASINSSGVGYMTIMIAGEDGPIEVNFTKDLLHGQNADYALANEFTYGSRAYTDLVERYPNFESLILGILNPIDIDTAVMAPNHSVLYCGDYFAEPYNDDYNDLIYSIPTERQGSSSPLIEEQEVNLIERIQEYISNVIFRWNTADYQDTDNLYWPSLLGNMYAHLPQKIMNIRLANCLTERAHTYHITEYLESHGELGRHVANIPIAQALYLYRNVIYHTRNYGKQTTFDDLVDNLLTPVRVPLASYNAVHDIIEMPDQIYPTAEMERNSINLTQVGTGRDLRTVEAVMKKEVLLARDNGEYLDERVSETELYIKRSRFSDLRSKVLESSMMDYTNTERYTLPEILFYNWVFAAAQGNYKGTLYVSHPYTGERIQLTPLNGLIMFHYLIYRVVMGEFPTKIPTLTARWIPKAKSVNAFESTQTGYPTMNFLKTKVVSDYVSDDDLNYFFQHPTPVLAYGATATFYTEVSKIWSELMRKQYKLYITEDFTARAQLEGCMRQFYWTDVLCDINTKDEDYATWIARQGITFDGMDDSDFLTLALSIYVKATGQDTSTKKSIADMQQSMLDIMKHFSSYTVQYLKGITFGSPVNTDAKLIRMSDALYSRGFAGLLGGNITMSKLNGKFGLLSLLGEFIPLRSTEYDPLVENSGWLGTMSGSFDLGSVVTNSVKITRHSKLPMSSLTTTTFNIDIM